MNEVALHYHGHLYKNRRNIISLFILSCRYYRLLSQGIYSILISLESIPPHQARMPKTITIDSHHIPLLESFLETIQLHIEELMVTLNKLTEVREHVPQSETQKYANVDNLIKYISLEACWHMRTFNTYKEIRDMVRPSAQTPDNVDDLT